MFSVGFLFEFVAIVCGLNNGTAVVFGSAFHGAKTLLLLSEVDCKTESGAPKIETDTVHFHIRGPL